MRLRVLAASLLALSLASTASAQDRDPQRAQALFDEAKKLMNDRQYAEACPKFAESNRLDPGLGTLLWLAGCYEKVGQTASAWTAFRSAAQLAHDEKDEREAVASEHVAHLEASLFRLTIVVPPEADLPDLEVRRDGVIVPKSFWGTAIAIDPGTHVVTANAPNRRTWEKAIEAVATGGNVTLTVKAPEPIPLHNDLPPPQPRGGTQRAVGWTLAAVGLAGVGLGTAFGLDAKSKNDASNAPMSQGGEGCVGASCPNAQGVALRNDALGSALASTASFIVGGVFVAAGITIVLLAPSSTVVLHAAVLPNGAAASLGGSF
jgi:tetratricopeptide (TPR) repeat protein